MRKGKLLKAIPILLFSPLVFSSLTGCGEIINEADFIRLSSNAEEAKNGTYKYKILDASNNEKNKDEILIGDTIEVYEIKPSDGYQLDDVTISYLDGTNTYRSVDITNTLKYEVKENFSLTLVVNFKALKAPDVKTSNVVIGNCEHGTITLEGFSSGDSHPDNTEIKVVVTPEEGYEIEFVKANDIDITSSLKFVTDENVPLYTISAKCKLINEPVIKSQLIISEGTLNGSIRFENYKDKDFVEDGTLINIIATPDDGYELDKILVNNEKINGTSFTTSKDVPQYIVKGVFKEIPPIEVKKSTISIDQNIINGIVSFDGYENGAEVVNNTKIIVKVKPNEGYELETLKVNNLDIKENKTFTTSDSVKSYVVSATFKLIATPDKTAIISYQNPENGTISFKGLENNSKVIIGTKVDVIVNANDGYELETLFVNDEDITTIKSFTASVENKTYLVKATFKLIETTPDVDTNKASILFNAIPTNDVEISDFTNTYTDSNEIVEDITGVKVFGGTGVRVGSKSSVGSLTITLKQEIVLSKISLDITKYGSDSKTFSVYLNDETNAVKKVTPTTGKVDITLNNVSVKSIKILGDEAKSRFYLNGLDLYGKIGDTPVDPSEKTATSYL